MVVLSFTLYMCTLIIYKTYAIGRMFHSPEMCSDEGINYCSFQFPNNHKNSCLIYNTNVCKNYDFSSWNLKSLSKPSSESYSEFIVAVLPYAAIIDDVHRKAPISAINISFISLNQNITGFSVLMIDDTGQSLIENTSRRNICRIFDFRNAQDTFNTPFVLFYDCFRYLVENHWQDVLMMFRSYPLNIELDYLVHIPSIPTKSSISPCDWRPLVMILEASLRKYYIQMKFSNAPDELNITFFLLLLWNSAGIELQRIRIPPGLKQDMISKEFMPVKGGYYSISINVTSTYNNCEVYRSFNFLVGEKPKDYSFISLIVLLIILIISGPTLLCFLCRRYMRSAISSSKPIVLLVYHDKKLQHEFLQLYSKYLENHYGVKVNTIYGRSGDPIAWLKAKLSESHVIIFVISEGLHQIFDQNSFHEGEHHWVDQLADAKALINNLKIGEKKFCKICFSYSGRQHIPKDLQHGGPIFMLPKDKDKFLCFIYDCSTKLKIIRKICCEKHHKAVNSNLKYKDEEKINEMLIHIKKEKHDTLPVTDSKITNENNLQNEYIKKPHALDEKYKFIEHGDSIKNYNSKTVISERGKCDIAQVNSKKSDVENMKSAECESNSANIENDDFILYLVRKIFNS